MNYIHKMDHFSIYSNFSEHQCMARMKPYMIISHVTDLMSRWLSLIICVTSVIFEGDCMTVYNLGELTNSSFHYAW